MTIGTKLNIIIIAQVPMVVYSIIGRIDSVAVGDWAFHLNAFQTGKFPKHCWTIQKVWQRHQQITKFVWNIHVKLAHETYAKSSDHGLRGTLPLLALQTKRGCPHHTTPGFFLQKRPRQMRSLCFMKARNICAMVKSRYIGDGHPTFNRESL